MKTCNKEGCNYPRFGGGFCKYHQYLREDKSPAKIKPQSEKQKDRMKEYMPIRNQYLKDHPKCEVEGCKRKSQDIHHQRGKIGDLLCDVRYFFAICRPCHIIAEENPAEAKKLGISGSRLGRE